jgi:hypothetical protein
MSLEEMLDSITSSVFNTVLEQGHSEQILGSPAERQAFRNALGEAYARFTFWNAELATALITYSSWSTAVVPVLSHFLQPSSTPRPSELSTVWQECLPQPQSQKQIDRLNVGAIRFLDSMEYQLRNKPEFNKVFTTRSSKPLMVPVNIPPIIRETMEPLFQGPNTTNLPSVLSMLAGKVSPEQRNILDQMTQMMLNLSAHQRLVSEWKQLHHLLHSLEAALAALVDITDELAGVRKTNPNFERVRNHWHRAVQPKIKDIVEFAEKEMRYIADPLVYEEGRSEGPDWVVCWISLQHDFMDSLEGKNAKHLSELATRSLADCQGHIQSIDSNLWKGITLLDQLTLQVLGGKSDDPVRH